MRNRVPVVIVAGYLGTGKTTLLNHLLAHGGGTRIGAVVNDFGAVGVDAMSVAGQVDSMVSLDNGCLCCAVDASGLERMLARLADARPPIDVIVIEASGLAEPRSLVRMVLASEDDRLAYGGLLELVDAVELEGSLERHPELADHIGYADLVVLNKTDRVDEQEARRVEALTSELADGRPVVATAHGRLDPGLLLDPVERRPDDGPRQLSFDDLTADDAGCGAGCDDHGGEHGHPHAHYQAVEFHSDTPLDPRGLMRFLDERPAGLFRAKGPVRFAAPGHPDRFELHTVGPYLTFHRTAWPAGEPRATRLVMIGTGLDADALRAALAACEQPDPDAADDQSMLRVLRHTD